MAANTQNVVRGPWPEPPTEIEKQQLEVSKMLMEMRGEMTEACVMGFDPEGRIVFRTTHSSPRDVISILRATIRFLDRA